MYFSPPKEVWDKCVRLRRVSMIDSRDINDLHPTLQRGAKELISRMSGTYSVGISSTYRCSNFQDYIYQQGRTRPGSIVTNARGGESIHNYRLAFDIYKNIPNQSYSDINFFKKAGQIWIEMGGVWGGSWKDFVDMPHFEYTGGLTLKDLKAGKILPNDAKMKWEKEKKDNDNIENNLEEDKEMRFSTLDQIPEWGQDAIKRLIEKGILKGTGESLDISQDMLRLIVINYRAGLY